MIGFIEGKLEYKSSNLLIINVGGIGYQIHVPTSLYKDLPQIGARLKLFTHLQVKEDRIELYGFLRKEDKDLFEVLLSVTDVGPKIALNILSTTSAGDFRQAILKDDFNLLMAIPGIGRKTAQRLIVELKEKIRSISLGEEKKEGQRLTGDNLERDAILALASLGYRRKVAKEAIDRARAKLEGNLTVEVIVKEALKYL